MFTGLISEMGRLRRADVRNDGLLSVEIEAPLAADSLQRGDSVAVNGVCLTATKVRRKRFTAEVVAETLAKTTLRDLQVGDRVNLELPPTPLDRLGGHLVQGHVDGIASILRVEPEGESRRMWMEPPPELLRYVASKGSVAVDGVSLTVAAAGRASFNVVLVPHTLATTTLGSVDVGDQVNLEVDVIAKYVERVLQPPTMSKGNL